jgi:hypothetical protein
VISCHSRDLGIVIIYIPVITIRMPDGSSMRYHGQDDTPSVLMNLIRSQCVVAVVKRLKVLATCREIW